MASADAVFLMRIVRTIRGEIAKAASTGPDIQYGNVTQVSPLKVLLDGSTTATTAYKDATYSPVVGDRVLIHIVRNEPVVAFKIG